MVRATGAVAGAHRLISTDLPGRRTLGVRRDAFYPVPITGIHERKERRCFAEVGLSKLRVRGYVCGCYGSYSLEPGGPNPDG